MDFVSLGKKFLALSITLFFLFFSISPVFADNQAINFPLWFYILSTKVPSSQLNILSYPETWSTNAYNYYQDFWENQFSYITVYGNSTLSFVYEFHDYYVDGDYTSYGTSFIFEGLTDNTVLHCYFDYWDGSQWVDTGFNYNQPDYFKVVFDANKYGVYNPLSPSGGKGMYDCKIRVRLKNNGKSDHYVKPYYCGLNTFKDSSISLPLSLISSDVSMIEQYLKELSLGTSSSTEAVSDLDNTSNILDENVNQFENLESGFLDDMTSSLDSLPSIDFTITDFGSTALFVSNQMQALYDSSNYIQFIIITPLIIGIALILIGRRDN